MFTHHCSSCDKTQLIFPSQITAMRNEGQVLAIDFTCWCSAPQTWVARETDRPAVAA